MMNKKIIKIFFVIVAIFIVTGCNKDSKNNSKNTNTGLENENTLIIEDTSDMKKLSCSREASAGSDVDVDLSYEIFYIGDYIQILHSKESITTENQATLDEYENAYKKIYKHYENLEYYDTIINRTSNNVTNDTVINYAKIDTDRLLEIEGEEDNIIKDGKVKLADWLEFAEKFGTKCN